MEGVVGDEMEKTGENMMLDFAVFSEMYGFYSK